MRRAAGTCGRARGDRVDVILGVEVCAGRFVKHVRAGFAAGFRGVAARGRRHPAHARHRVSRRAMGRRTETARVRTTRVAFRRERGQARRRDGSRGETRHRDGCRGNSSRSTWVARAVRRNAWTPSNAPALAGCRFPEAMPDTDALPPRRPRPRGRPPPPRSGPMNVRDLARRVRIGGSDARADHTLARRRQ